MTEVRPSIPGFDSSFLRYYVIVVAVLIGLSLVVTQGNTLSYLAILFASALRNRVFPWLGSGVLFYAVVFVGFLIEAVFITALVSLGMRFLKSGR